ncbi:MAG: YbjN domain-containing protein [Gemmataceae bacterium]|nr:YbjN domain-containing protein [Gemmataceae bacterium]
MSGLFSKLIDFMDKEEWKYEILEGETTIRFHFKTKTGRLLCFGDVEEDKQFVLFYSYLPVNVPDDKLVEIAEFLTRANRGIRIGNFEMDYDTGEICYKTSLDIEGGDLTHKVMDNLLRANLSTTDRYFRGIMEVIFGDKEPAEAIQSIEKPGSRRNTDEQASDDEDDNDMDDEDEEEEDFDDDISLDDEELLRDDEDEGRRGRN